MLGIFQNFGAGEIILILVVLLLLFGARKLPELARSMGRSTKEFKAGMQEGATEPPDEDAPATTGDSTGSATKE